MSFEDVMRRGDDFLSEYPRRSKLWNYASHATCLFMILQSKFLLNVLYRPQIHNVEILDEALARSRREGRPLLTIMNHMSVVDDPCFYAALPMRFHLDIDTIRWGFGAHNVCFSNVALSWFFNLGKILGTQRFGHGPFQGSVDAAIRIMSPDDTLELEFGPLVKQVERPRLIQEVNNVVPGYSKVKELVKKVKKVEGSSPEARNILMAQSPFLREKTSWFHVFPEGFVLQLEPPHNNSMRYFKWGVSRLILESTRSPIVVPIFTYGFEKIAPEDVAEDGIRRYLPANLGSEIHINIGQPLPDTKIESYRKRWRDLCKKYIDGKNPTDLSPELRTGKKVQSLRSELAADLRKAVSSIRESLGVFAPEDSRFSDPAFWKKFTLSEGASAPDVKFIGKNWAIRRLQKHLPDYEEDR